MNAKKILAILLAVLMLAPVFVACDKETPDTPDTPDTDPVSDQATDTQPPEDPGLVLDKTDFGGTNLRIIGINEERNFGYYQTSDIWMETEAADPFENAVYKRIQDCLTKYNFGVEYTKVQVPTTDIASLVSGGLDQFDVVLDAWNYMWPAAKAGNLLDLREIASIDLTHEWWDQNANEQLDVANRMFYTAGDFTTVDDRCTRALYFNKTLAAANDLESPYELVRANQWTLDKFAQMARDVKNDVDGGGTVDTEDVVGFFRESGQFNSFMIAMGERYANIDENGLPVYSFLQDAESVTKMEAVAGLLIEDGVTIDIHKFTDFGGYDNRFTYARSLFAAGKHLFTVGGSLVISEFADMEDEFGILPMPKWNSDQDRYYHTLDPQCAMIGIPNTKTDATDIGYMMEYFSYEGRETLSPTFKDRMLKRRYAQDSDSGDMLDIIYANKCFDIGYVGNWSNMLGVGDSAVQANRLPRMNAYTKMAKTIPGLIQKDFDLLASIGRE